MHYVCTDETELEGELERVSRMAFDAAPGAVADAKALVRDVTGAQIDHALSVETAKRIAHRRATDEGREGLAAFLAKRKPSWAD